MKITIIQLVLVRIGFQFLVVVVVVSSSPRYNIIIFLDSFIDSLSPSFFRFSILDSENQLLLQFYVPFVFLSLKSLPQLEGHLFMLRMCLRSLLITVAPYLSLSPTFLYLLYIFTPSSETHLYSFTATYSFLSQVSTLAYLAAVIY